MENADLRVVEYRREVTPLVERAQAITELTTDAQVVEATEVLSNLNRTLDAVEAEKEKVLKPLREAAKAEKARWAPIEEMFSAGVAHLRGLLSEYQTRKVKEKEVEEKRILDRVGEGRGYIKPETAIAKLEEMQTPAEKVVAESGALSFRESKQLKVTDPALVPDEYWMIDEKALLADLKKGISVPGAEIEVIQVPVNKR